MRSNSPLHKTELGARQVVDVGRSLAADRRQHSKRVANPGQGDELKPVQVTLPVRTARVLARLYGNYYVQ